MKIAVACNAFKESMSSVEAAAAVEAGFRSVFGSRAVVWSVPIADGGDGTLDAVASSVDSVRVKKKVKDPLGRIRSAEYLLVDGGKTAVVEMARTSGLAMLEPGERNPEKTSTAGLGGLVKDALDRGVLRVIIGIGGSATNDGGAGMASELGYRFLNASGRPVRACGGNLGEIRSIESSGAHPRIAQTAFLVASDVTNPLLGPRGASAVYGPQKGASSAQVKRLEKGLARLAEVVERDLGVRLADYPGAGAAGGAGYGLMAFLWAELKPGIDLMVDITGLEKKVKNADLVITGEGRMDSQSVQGKAPFGVLKLALKYGKPVLAFCGSVENEHELSALGFSAVCPIVDRPMTLEDAISGGKEMLERAARRSALLLKTGKMKL